jgi:hypothetical protein
VYGFLLEHGQDLVDDGWVANSRDGWLIEGWVAMSVARQLATAVLWVRIQTSLKNHTWATLAKEWPTHLARQKNIKKGFLLEHGLDLVDGFLLEHGLDLVDGFLLEHGQEQVDCVLPKHGQEKVDDELPEQ